LRIVALTMALLGISDPRLGVTRQDVIAPSTDTMLIIDVSGSMDESFQTGSSGGAGPSKLQPPKTR